MAHRLDPLHDACSYLMSKNRAHAPDTLCKGCLKPRVQVWVGAHKVRTHPQVVRNSRTVIEIRPDEGGVLFHAGMLIGGTRRLVEQQRCRHRCSSSPNARRYSATTVASVTRVEIRVGSGE